MNGSLREGIARWGRALLAACFFIAFALGALVIGFVLFPLLRFRGVHRADAACAMRRTVRASFRLFVWAARRTGLFRVEISPEDCARLAAARGAVVVANHLTLIDVVILLAHLPDATAIAKAPARSNPFYARIVSGVFLVNDHPEHVVGAAARLLVQGVNLVVFPQGTRMPPDAPRSALRRGAARCALAAHAPILCLKLTCDPPVLGRGQTWHDVGSRTIVYTLRVCGEIAPMSCPCEVSPRMSAVSITSRIAERLGL